MISTLWKNELYKLLKKKKIYYSIAIIVFSSLLQVMMSYNKMNSVDTKTYWNAVSDSMSLMVIVTIVAITICCDIFCEDFSLKTIKTLFTRPNKRSTVWFAKLLTALTMLLGLSFVLVLTSMVSNLFFYDFFEPGQDMVFVDINGNTIEKSYAYYMLQRYFAFLVEAAIYIILTTFCAVIFKSASLTTTISLVVLLGGNVIVSLFEQKLEWIKYTLLYNMDLSQYINHGSNYWGVTPIFSCLIIMLHCAVFVFVGIKVYCGQEVY